MNAYSVRARLRHFLSEGSPYRIHSPFVYDLLTQVIRAHPDPADDTIPTRIKHTLLSDSRVIYRTDHGSGHTGPITVRKFTRSSAVPRKTGRLLERLTHHLKPKTILELGTGMGLSTLHMMLGCPEARCITLEGCPETAKVALEQFRLIGLTPEVKAGPFHETLPAVLNQMTTIDFAFIDGNHRERPTLDYFTMIAERCHSRSCLVLHDIHWSAEMASAWKTIAADQRATVTIDLFDLGLVFFREQAKEGFVLRW